MKYRKKPVVIDAEQFDGSHGSADKIVEWSWGAVKKCYPPTCTGLLSHLSIDTLEGQMTATGGDWIIRGVKGEFYPCKPDIFDLTYEAVTP